MIDREDVVSLTPDNEGVVASSAHRTPATAVAVGATSVILRPSEVTQTVPSAGATMTVSPGKDVAMTLPETAHAARDGVGSGATRAGRSVGSELASAPSPGGIAPGVVEISLRAGATTGTIGAMRQGSPPSSTSSSRDGSISPPSPGEPPYHPTGAYGSADTVDARTGGNARAVAKSQNWGVSAADVASASRASPHWSGEGLKKANEFSDWLRQAHSDPPAHANISGGTWLPDELQDVLCVPKFNGSSGVLLTNKWLLTAAHVIKDKTSGVSAVWSSHAPETDFIDEVFLFGDRDVALIRLKAPFSVDQNRVGHLLPIYTGNPSDIWRRHVLAAGYGQTKTGGKTTSAPKLARNFVLDASLVDQYVGDLVSPGGGASVSAWINPENPLGLWVVSSEAEIPYPYTLVPKPDDWKWWTTPGLNIPPGIGLHGDSGGPVFFPTQDPAFGTRFQLAGICSAGALDKAAEAFYDTNGTVIKFIQSDLYAAVDQKIRADIDRHLWSTAHSTTFGTSSDFSGDVALCRSPDEPLWPIYTSKLFPENDPSTDDEKKNKHAGDQRYTTYVFTISAKGVVHWETYRLLPDEDSGVREQVDSAGVEWGSLPAGGRFVQGTPATVCLTGQRIDIFARSAENTLLWRSRPDASAPWGDWVELPGSIFSSPTAVSRGGDSMDLFARGPSSTLVRATFDGDSWLSDSSGSVWTEVAPSLTFDSDPCAVVHGSAILVVARSGSDVVATVISDESASPWVDLGGEITGSPCIVSPVPGRLDLFARSADNTVLHKWFDAQWTDWIALSLFTAGNPKALSPFPGDMQLFLKESGWNYGVARFPRHQKPAGVDGTAGQIAG